MDEVKEHAQNGDTWVRGFYILLFLFFLSVARLVVWAIVIFQFGARLLTGQINESVRAFGDSLVRYITQTLGYVMQNRERKPWPFAEWPKIKEHDESAGGSE